MLTEVFYKIILPILFKSVSLTVFKKFLLTLKSYLLGESESIFVLGAFLLVARKGSAPHVCGYA